MNDHTLLNEYIKGNSDTAFKQLTDRYTDLVYSIALQQTADPHLAEDITQTVFIILAKKAHKLKKTTVLSGWLYRTVRFAAANALRVEKRRKAHEQEASKLTEQYEYKPDDPKWTEILPLLGTVMNRLRKADRHAILLRFYEKKKLREVGSALGISEEAAEKRVSRALQKLRKLLVKRGVAYPCALLGMVLGENAIHAAPAGLASSCHTASMTFLKGNLTALTEFEHVNLIAKGVMKMMMWKKITILTAFAAVTLLIGAAGIAGIEHLAENPSTIAVKTETEKDPASSADTGKVILDKKSYWRCFTVRGSDLVRKNSGNLAHLQEFSESRLKIVKAGKKKIRVLDEIPQGRYTSFPDKDWAATGFNDSAWPQAKTPFYCSKYWKWHKYESTKQEKYKYTKGIWLSPFRTLVAFFLRGKFHVKDPSKVKDLRLSLTFHGGAIVYVNGREVTRAYMPEGDIALSSPAEDYPKEVFVASDGALLAHKYTNDLKANIDGFKMRTRTISNLKIPASFLKKGVNVLAIEFHRAPAPEVYFSGRARKKHLRLRSFVWWPRLAVGNVKLTAPAGPAVTPNTSRLSGLQVWTPPVSKKVKPNDYGDPNEPVHPIKIVGVRNGVFSGKIVIGSTETLRGLRAEAADLKGLAMIPAANIQVRYTRPGYDGKGKVIFDDWLENFAPAEVPLGKRTGAAIQPIWVTVHVPVDAKAGEYKGKLTAKIERQKPVEVPIHLEVSDWVLPDAQNFITHVGLMQSPDTLAMKYDVPMWSKAHWRLIEKSFKLMGEVGNDVLYITLVRRTHLGNEHGMVRWIRQSDGSLKPDLSIAEKYLDLACKHMGKPSVVGAYCFDSFAWKHSEKNTPEERKKYKLKVADLLEKAQISIFDPKTGTLDKINGPKWGTPESRAFWKPVFEALSAMLRKHGLEKSMMLAMVGDYILAGGPVKKAVEDLKIAAPGVPWVRHDHPAKKTSLYGVPIAYRAGVWLIGPTDPDFQVYRKKRYYGWKNPSLRVIFPRSSGPYVLHLKTPLETYRFTAEGAFVSASELRGIGRIGADFWAVIKGARGSARSLCGRYPESHMGQLHMAYSFPFLLAPGKEGAIATGRYEMMRESLQEAEARVFIEKALLNPKLKVKLGEPLCTRLQKMLDDRVRIFMRANGVHELMPDDHLWYYSENWQKRSAELYSAAAEVAKKLGIK